MSSAAWRHIVERRLSGPITSTCRPRGEAASPWPPGSQSEYRPRAIRVPSGIAAITASVEKGPRLSRWRMADGEKRTKSGAADQHSTRTSWFRLTNGQKVEVSGPVERFRQNCLADYGRQLKHVFRYLTVLCGRGRSSSECRFRGRCRATPCRAGRDRSIGSRRDSRRPHGGAADRWNGISGYRATCRLGRCRRRCRLAQQTAEYAAREAARRKFFRIGGQFGTWCRSRSGLIGGQTIGEPYAPS